MRKYFDGVSFNLKRSLASNVSFQKTFLTKDRIILICVGVVVVGGLSAYEQKVKTDKKNAQDLMKLHEVTRRAQEFVGNADYDGATKCYADARKLIDSVVMSSEEIQKSVMLQLNDQLGHLAYNLENWEEASIYVRESERLMIELDKPQDDQAYLEVLMMRAKLDAMDNRMDAALAAFRKCISTLEEGISIANLQTAGNEERLTLYGVSLQEYGTYTKSIGQLQESEHAFSKALNIAKVVLGPRHEQTSVIANDLATVYDEEGRYNKAERLVRKAIQIASETSPAYLATYKYNLGEILMHKGETVDAAQELRDALVIAEEQEDEELMKTIESSVMKLDVPGLPT